MNYSEIDNSNNNNILKKQSKQKPTSTYYSKNDLFLNFFNGLSYLSEYFIKTISKLCSSIINPLTIRFTNLKTKL